MNLTSNIVLNSYSIIFLLLLYIHSVKHYDNVSANSKIYIKTILITIVLLFLDGFSRFDGNPETISPYINNIGNFLLFLLSPVLPSFWVIYVHLQLYNDEKKTQKLVYPLIAVNLIHGILVIFNLFYGYFYTIDQQNIYARGPLFILSASFSMLLLIAASGLVLFNRKNTNSRYYFPLMFFIFPPAISIILQLYLYGSSLILNSVVFSLLIISLNIQNKSIYTDHLTGVYNRKMLDKYLKEKIGGSTPHKTFSAIMIDLNDFKKINDTYGHDMGDQALQCTVKILKNSIKSTDFIARFGGDEFWIVLNNSNSDELMGTINKININLAKYNNSNTNTYQLAFSMGYSVYNYDSRMQVEAFQKYIDKLMYENKSNR